MEFEPKIVTVKDLLLNDKISIPDYQRPYKWGLTNVNQMVDDILEFSKTSAYRLGTIVLHNDQSLNKLQVVDGQQRTITLILLAQALFEMRSEDVRKEKADLIKPVVIDSLRLENVISQTNIKQNYLELKRRVQEFTLEQIFFFYLKCELVEVAITDISEAFQFFDSQNARGKDLLPHDLLKAFHLREMMDQTTEVDRKKIVAHWENEKEDDLANFFSKKLFRIREWSKGNSARHFNKVDVGVFKGLNPQNKQVFPFSKLHRIGHFYVESYNEEYHRQIDAQKMIYPFQIDQVLMNGKRFFEFVAHYREMNKNLINLLKEKCQGQSLDILNLLDDDEKYKARHRTGDQYVRNLFECALFRYVDKFGFVEIDRAIEKLFLWAYRLRLELQSVKLASIDNYALAEPFVFKRLHEALSPREVLTIPIPILDKPKMAKKLEALKSIFVNKGVLHE